MFPFTTQQLSKGGSFSFTLKLSLSLGNAVFDLTVYYSTGSIIIPCQYNSKAKKGVVGWEVVGEKNAEDEQKKEPLGRICSTSEKRMLNSHPSAPNVFQAMAMQYNVLVFLVKIEEKS